MNTLELIKEEIRYSYLYDFLPDKNRIAPNYYQLHCSRVFAHCLYKSFKEIAFVIPSTEAGHVYKEPENINVYTAKYEIPYIGTIEVIVDMEQGYKIIRLENAN